MFSSNLLVKGNQPERNCESSGSMLGCVVGRDLSSTATGNFYDQKRPNVTAIFKTDKMKDPENSRSVSFTSLLWRTMERVLLKVISRHKKDKKETGRTQSHQ